ncbi:hypothetical protein B0H13DRAFT_2563770 [Mycena leptocephala]|nr:hypothetical protein B0H13DRAFT_2563770 [Mycena leptocephala]
MCTHLPAPQMYEHSNMVSVGSTARRSLRMYNTPAPHRPPHTTRLAYTRLAHARPLRSTDLHALRPPPMYRRVRRTFHRIQPHPPQCSQRKSAAESTAHGVFPPALSHRARHKRGRRCAQSCTSPVPSHAETSTPHVGIRICAIAIACAHTRSSRSLSLYACSQSPAPHPTCGAFPEHLHSRPMHPPLSQARRLSPEIRAGSLSSTFAAAARAPDGAVVARYIVAENDDLNGTGAQWAPDARKPEEKKVEIEEER